MTRSARLASCAAVVLLAFGALPAHAIDDGFFVQVGGSRTPHRGGTGAVFVEAVQDMGPMGESAWNVGLTGVLGAVGGRARAYARTVVLGGAGARLQRQGQSWFFEENVVVAGGRTPALSGPVEFMTSFGWSVEQWELVARHVSNAGFSGPNQGETMILVGRRF